MEIACNKKEVLESSIIQLSLVKLHVCLNIHKKHLLNLSRVVIVYNNCSVAQNVNKSFLKLMSVKSQGYSHVN